MSTDQEIVLNLVYHCTSESKQIPNIRNITFDASSPPETAEEIISKIEEEVQIPSTAMTLEIHSVPLQRHTEMKWFKLRSGDTITVRYYSVCDCKEVDECIALLKTVLDGLQKVLLDLPAHVSSGATFELKRFQKFLPPQGSANRINTFHSQCISKWLDPRSYANKINFIDKSGLLISSKIMQCIFEVKTLSPFLYYNFFKSFEIELLNCLWDITEDDYIREEVMKSGGVDNCLNILCASSIQARILKVIGTLANLCECTKARLQIGSRDDAIERIYQLMTNKSVTYMYNKINVHRASMVILYLAYSPENHHHLVTQELFDSVLLDTPSSNDDFIPCLIRFNMAVFCSILTLMSPQLFTDKQNTKQEMNKIMKSFADEADIKQISDFEIDMGIYWSTIKPLLEAIYTCQNTMGSSNDEMVEHNSKRTIVITLLSLLLREYHRDIMVKEGMVDFVLCLPWYTPDEAGAKRLGETIREAPDVPYQPPSLLNMCKAAVAVYHCGLHDVMRLTVPELANKLWKM